MDKVVITVREQEDIARSRRAARSMAVHIGMDRYESTEVETSTSELSTNLIRYAGGGTITLEVVQQGNRRGIKVVSEDQGPGIEDISLAMSEGYSTKGYMGSGLPSVKRMMDEFDICSEPGAGTTVVATKWKRVE